MRRNRRRFWKGELDADKRAAYDTLRTVLVGVTRLVAPFVPHLADAIWENLVTAVDPAAPDSVHLADFPTTEPGRRDVALEEAVERARAVAALGHSARAASGVRVRQPLAAVRVRRAGGGSLADDPAVDGELVAAVLDELNVKSFELIPDASALVERTLRPLLPVLGPRRGAAVAAVMAAARSGEWSTLPDGRVEAGGVVLEPDEFELVARARPGHAVAEEGDLLVALDTSLTPALEAEGLAREVAHRLQGLRKEAGYEISDRVEIAVDGASTLVEALVVHRDWLAGELLATTVEVGPGARLADPDRTESAEIGGERLDLFIRRAV